MVRKRCTEPKSLDDSAKVYSKGPVDPRKFQCENCSEIFSEEEFEHHACLYDEFHQLNTTPGSEETKLQQLQRSTISIMKGNQASMSEMLRSNKSKTSNIECSKCCRKFVHENGLYRHYDMHIGELLAESPPVNPDVLQPVALCVFCGEIFSNDAQAWDHIVSYHLHVDNIIIHSQVPMEHELENSVLDSNNNIIVKVSIEVSSCFCAFIKQLCLFRMEQQIKTPQIMQRRVAH